MITTKDVQKLSDLARIRLSDDEKNKLAHEVGSILDYVGEIKNASLDLGAEGRVGAVKNILRDDVVQNKAGEFSQDLLNQAPKREGDYVSVKKIINQDDFDL